MWNKERSSIFIINVSYNFIFLTAGTLDSKTEVAVKAKWSKIMGLDYEIVVCILVSNLI